MKPDDARRRYLVRITRLPLDEKRRTLLRAVDRLPSDWKSRSIVVDDFVFVDAASDEDAAMLALHKTRIRVDGGEIILAAEMDRTTGTARPLPALPTALEGPMPAHRPIPPEEWVVEIPFDYDPDRLPPTYEGRDDSI